MRSDEDDASTPSEEAVGMLYEQHVAETERMSKTLERIAAILEKRPLA